MLKTCERRTCAVCQKVFETMHPRQKYCTYDCAYAVVLKSSNDRYAQNRQPTVILDKVCVICNKPYQVPMISFKSKACSDVCRIEMKALSDQRLYERRKHARD